MATTPKQIPSTAASVGNESKLWHAAGLLWPDIDAAENMHAISGRILLKFIFAAFEEHHSSLLVRQARGTDPEDGDGISRLELLLSA